MATDEVKSVTVSHDPDFTECYSDHANDIRYSGECAFCGSTEENVIGYILPGTRRFRGIDCVRAARMVFHSQTAHMFDGMLLDHFSASAVVSVYNALSTETARDKLRAMPLEKAVTVCFKILNQNRS